MKIFNLKFCLLIILSILITDIPAQTCVQMPNGMSIRNLELPNGTCNYSIELCITVPNAPKPKRIEFEIDYDSNGDGTKDAKQSFTYNPGRSIPAGTYCLSSFSPSAEFSVPNVTCGEVFKAAITGYTNASGGSGGNCTTEIGYVTELGYDTSLPIDLINFEAKALDKRNVIKWSTNFEENNYAQIIERSNNPNNGFREIGRFLSEGNSSEIKNYEFFDEAPIDLSYYRLASLDRDGTITYSEIIVIERPNQKLEIKKLYPSPAGSFISIQFKTPKSGKLNITLVNTTGSLIKKIILDAQNGINISMLDISDLSPGIFFINIDDGFNSTKQKFVKSNNL